MIPVGALVTMPGFEPLSVVVERFAAPTGTDYQGAPIVAAATLLTITMVSHQATRRQLVREGLDLAQDWRAFYSNLPIVGAGSRTRPDVLRAFGERWEVENVGDYGVLGGIYLALAKRIE